MKIKMNLLTMFTGAVFLLLATLLTINDDYSVYQNRTCVVKDAFYTPTKSSTNFYVILIDEKTGKFFDLKVNPTTYSLAKKQKKLVFKLREFDVKQDLLKNFWYMFIEPISWVVGVFVFLFGFLNCFKKNETTKNKL